jgi:hypothetical protein
VVGQLRNRQFSTAVSTCTYWVTCTSLLCQLLCSLLITLPC